MTILVVGGSGATGKRLVDHLLNSGQTVRIIVRSSGRLPEHWKNHPHLTIIERSVSEISIEEMSGYVSGCHAVASCLGHNLTLKGLYGKPRKLVTDTVCLLCDAIVLSAPDHPVRFVLMNTAGNRNRDVSEPVSLAQKILLSLLRVLVPPHLDNEMAADYLRTKVGQRHPNIEWAAVRPDTLVDEEEVTPYSLHASPVRSALFDPGHTSRINVGHFMAQLITNDALWNTWKGQMPVIYNQNPKKK